MKLSYRLPSLLAVLLLSLSLGALGCKPKSPATASSVSDERVTRSPAVPPAQPIPAPYGPSGELTGTVNFTGKPPVMAMIDTSMDPVCSLAGGKLTAEQIVVDKGKLANVFVYVKSGPPAAMQASPLSTQPVVLDQKSCRYSPHVIGVMQGSPVEFRNSDPTMHNIHTMPADDANPPMDVSQGPRGAPLVKQFNRPELMMPVRCNNHPWMNAFVNISATPFFAVTDGNGRFDLRGLPPGDYVLAAVQEKLGEKTLSVHIAPDSTTKAEFTFSAK